MFHDFMFLIVYSKLLPYSKLCIELGQENIPANNRDTPYFKI
tara:strand:+ start:854 stop:979 length:126 start_codon:yes stop_codon:yes gene_type:complete